MVDELGVNGGDGVSLLVPKRPMPDGVVDGGIVVGILVENTIGELSVVGDDVDDGTLFSGVVVVISGMIVDCGFVNDGSVGLGVVEKDADNEGEVIDGFNVVKV